MQLLILLLALAFRRLWGAPNPVQRDGWFWSWIDWLTQNGRLEGHPLARLALAVGSPVVGLLIVAAILASLSTWLLLPLGIGVVLYALGRSAVSERVDTFNSAHACGDWELAARQAVLLGVDRAGIAEGDWVSLHEQVMAAAAYRAFEKTFAVIFWFLLLGPAGALLYRLSYLYQPQDGRAAERWLGWLEWPAARLLGLSFAVTGNFTGCFRRWRPLALSSVHSSQTVLYESAVGALLGEPDPAATIVIQRRELSGLLGLYMRTFWLWIGLIGVAAILG